MKVYISTDHNNRKKISKELITLTTVLTSANINSVVGVDKIAYNEEKKEVFISNIFKEIEESNFIIVEGNHINNLSCTEVGYAKAKKKPILFIKKSNTEEDIHFIESISNYSIYYDSFKDLFDQMTEFLKKILKN